MYSDPRLTRIESENTPGCLSTCLPALLATPDLYSILIPQGWMNFFLSFFSSSVLHATITGDSIDSIE